MCTGVNNITWQQKLQPVVLSTKHLMMIHPQLFWVCLTTNGALCLIISSCYISPAGEYRLSRKDGAHNQGVPHPCQPLGSVLQPVSRTYRNLHTGRSDKGSIWRLPAIFRQEFAWNLVSGFCFQDLTWVRQTGDHVQMYICLLSVSMLLPSHRRVTAVVQTNLNKT